MPDELTEEAMVRDLIRAAVESAREEGGSAAANVDMIRGMLAERHESLRAETARLREENTAREADPTFRELRRENADLRAECGALRDSLLASVVALAAERERALCDALAWAWYEIGDGDHRDKGGFDPGRDEFVAAGLIAIRAITPAPGAADTSTEAP